LTDSDTDHAAVQASGIEKSVVDGCGSKFHTDLREATFDREYPASFSIGGTLRAFCNSPVHEQWLLHVAFFSGAMFTSTGSFCIIALILQSQKLTALCCSAVYIDFVGTLNQNYSTQSYGFLVSTTTN
jgi:hypothetical protein